jgi:hypothetical protein
MTTIEPLDDAHMSGGTVGAQTRIVEPGAPPTAVVRDRPRIELPRTGASSVSKGALSASLPGKPKYTLSGGATFYDNGTTAMRLPRGTVVKICGNGGCIVRVVNDYGPQKKSRVRLPVVCRHHQGHGVRLLTPARYPSLIPSATAP